MACLAMQWLDFWSSLSNFYVVWGEGVFGLGLVFSDLRSITEILNIINYYVTENVCVHKQMPVTPILLN